MITPGEADRQWLLQYFPQATADQLEWFLERVAIRCESGMHALQSLNLTYYEYLQRYE